MNPNTVIHGISCPLQLHVSCTSDEHVLWVSHRLVDRNVEGERIQGLALAILLETLPAA